MKINRYINQLPPCDQITGYCEPLCYELAGRTLAFDPVTLTIRDKDTLLYTAENERYTLRYQCLKLDADAYTIGFALPDGVRFALAVSGKSICALRLAPDGQARLSGQSDGQRDDRFAAACFDLLFGPYVRYLHAPGAQALRDITLCGDHIALYIPGDPGAFLFVNALSMRAVGFCLPKTGLAPIAGYGGFIREEDRAEAFA